MELVDGYRLAQPLSVGGARFTFAAHDVALDRAVVLHFPGDPFSGDRPDSESELAWVRALARVDHPSLAALYRVGRFRERPYAVSEYVRGRRLDEVGVIEPRRAVSVVRAVAEVIGAHHRAALAHGGIASDAIVIGEDGAPRLFRAAALGNEARIQDLRALSRIIENVARDPSLEKLQRIIARSSPPAIEEVLAALVELSGETAAEGAEPAEPYRGLRPFELAHRSLFFGRDEQVERVLSRLRSEPRVVIAGRSGSGKSSLARAGVGALVEQGALGERPRWRVIAFAPGSRPLDALGEALGRGLGIEPPAGARFAREGGLLSRILDQQGLVGTLILVDQLEEIFSIASESERGDFLRVLAPLAMVRPGVRLLFTVRSDFLGALFAHPSTGGDLAPATMLLGEMSELELSEAIAAPARRFGFELESREMIDGLAKEASSSANALPLVSFVLSELWARRDHRRRVIPMSALDELGGVRGAIADHAERVLGAMAAEEQREAQRIMLMLVSTSATSRAVGGELLAPQQAERAGSEASEEAGRRIHSADDRTAARPVAKRALDALVRGRLVVAGEDRTPAYALAHEALMEAWPRFRAWLEESSEAHRAATRLADAAREWARAGRPRDLLWDASRLAEPRAEVLERAKTILGAEAASAEEFLAAGARAVRRDRLLRWSFYSLLPLIFGAIAGLAWLLPHLEARRELSAICHGAERSLAAASAEETNVLSLRASAFEAFDRGDRAEAEQLWARVLADARRLDANRQQALEELERVLAVDPDHPRARALAADAILARLLAAEREFDWDRVQLLASRLEQFDDGTRRAYLSRPAELTIEVSPADAELRIADKYFAVRPGQKISLDPGTYYLLAHRTGFAEVKVPIALSRGEKRSVRIALLEQVPDGFVYVPGGKFLYGARGDEDLRRMLDAEPAHEIEIPAFLIGRHEVTAPAGFSFDRAEAHVAQLREKMPGARLCSEREWEYAARGADGRRYPQGDVLREGDACAGKDGPCAPGSHPGSRSVFGVDDLTGNVWEWTRDPPSRTETGLGVLRGGSWSDELGSPFLFVANRGIRPKSVASQIFGLRVCADLPR